MTDWFESESWKLVPLGPDRTGNHWYGLMVYHHEGDSWEGAHQFISWPTLEDVRAKLIEYEEYSPSGGAS